MNIKWCIGLYSIPCGLSKDFTPMDLKMVVVLRADGWDGEIYTLVTSLL